MISNEYALIAESLIGEGHFGAEEVNLTCKSDFSFVSH